ncbi:MAG: histidine phosphatase family protein [Flavobacteriales bacterium]|nr:histidine phosphatase family protein [Flavobacteriales bacterium]
MFNRRIWSHLVVITALVSSSCSSMSKTTTVPTMTTIYVVRHAEKLTTDFDTPLSPAGEQRAQALAEQLAEAGVQRIYATQRQRTQQTVAPLAARLKLEVVVLEPNAVDSLVQRIKREDSGHVVLVAGHNNTVPAIVQGLAGQPVDAIPEHVFDRLYRVQLPDQGPATVAVLNYGVPTP